MLRRNSEIAASVSVGLVKFVRKAPSVMKGYWRNAEANAAAFTQTVTSARATSAYSTRKGS
jgi:hypothetical protein